MKLKALRAHYLDGSVQAVGAVYDAHERIASALIAAGKAVVIAEPPAPEAAPQPLASEPATSAPAAPAAEKTAAPKRKHKPMTAAATSALVPGAPTEKDPNHD